MYFRYTHPELKHGIITVTPLPYSLVFCIAEHLFPRRRTSKHYTRLLLPRVKIEEGKYVMVSGQGTSFVSIEEYKDGKMIEDKILEAIRWMDDNPDVDIEEQVERMAEIFSVRIVCRVEELLVYDRSASMFDRSNRLNPARYRRINRGFIEKGRGDSVFVWSVTTNEREQDLFISRLEYGCKDVNAIKRALARSNGNVTQFIYEAQEDLYESSDESSDEDDLPSPSNRVKRRREGEVLDRDEVEKHSNKSVVCPQCGGTIALGMMKEAIDWCAQSRTRKYIACPHCSEAIGLEEMAFAVKWAERNV